MEHAKVLRQEPDWRVMVRRLMWQQQMEEREEARTEWGERWGWGLFEVTTAV
jgi:hypothetical protein